jgi:hypothetical protein
MTEQEVRDQQDQQQGEVHYLWQVVEKLEERIEVLEEGSNDPANYPMFEVGAKPKKKGEA